MRKIKHPWNAPKSSPPLPCLQKINTETASSELNQTAPDLLAELHFTEVPEAEFRWTARETDGKDAEEDFEKE